MEKLNNILKNLYDSDSSIMLYIYIAIAVVTVILVLVIIISSIRTRKVNKLTENKVIQNESASKPELIKEETTVQPEDLPIKEEKPLVLTESVTEIKPIPVKEDVQTYDKPLELEPELDLTRPIQRVSTASDLLNEFLPNDNLTKNLPTQITSEDLNKPLVKKEEVNRAPEIYSSVFLDKKPSKPKIQLELTPINPVKIDKIPEPKVEAKELILEPKVLKPEIKEEKQSVEPKTIKENSPKPELPQLGKEGLTKIESKPNQLSKEESKKITENKEIQTPKPEDTKPKGITPEIKNSKEAKEEIKKEDESLDTKVDIFSHESLVQKNLGFDPFKPKTQEELLSSEEKTSKPEQPSKPEPAPTVLSAEDLKNRLSLLQSKVNKKDTTLDDVLKQVGLDDISELYNEPQIENTRGLRR